MSLQTIMNCGLILIGAIIMLVSIVRVERLMKSMQFSHKLRRKQIRLFLVLHRELMLFFFIGYIVVMMTFIRHNTSVSEILVSFIFLCGAIFAYLGINVQSQLLVETEDPLKGILPICTECKQIRVEDEGPKGSKNWKRIETYISEKTKVRFTHGYCPKCFDKVWHRIEGSNEK